MPAGSTGAVERAAGGVLYRPAAAGLEICVVHRPRYDDWSLPKGKLSDGEPPLAAAVREVEEETGTAGIPQLRLPDVDYPLPGGRPKNVAFWLMRAGSDGPVQDTDEVDELAWLPLDEAAARLTYADERDIVAHVAALPPVTAVIALVRHARAGERKKWAGRDELRPIDPVGVKQADRIADLLTPLRPRRLVAAPPLRCAQTLEPLAAALGGLPIVRDSAVAEPPGPDWLPARLAAARSRLAELRAHERVVVCSQGKLMPQLLASLHDDDATERFRTPKGDGWLLTWSGDRLMGASRL
ncbi:8-oxo-dGTP diphosphatase [Actinoplanes campanulatus]|uniref:8-oxo-dGTP diphosphatase n=1 Tax=Actinoplanes campanulatus TaxID=113559 RepID=A0A7W5FC86_9ACTN|nr:NUDIX hydrolase [Actinoplanes campanulatus]MBB3093174.1 8-oxo-dGTP diphosphatase [Actinoplanes campanulatus]GGN01694.1 putative hydrolase MutT/NUDIX [Actinoplanes campanulatus]GID33730.1 putative hydrolase MutT/NUDIX [Actinoplanes campanulatus]